MCELMQNVSFIKSPLNYTGGKYKLLPQIIPLFPNKIDSFIDVFGGGFNVGINVEADRIVYNDVCVQVVDLLKQFYANDVEDIQNKICETMKKYGLDRSNPSNKEIISEGYYSLRSSYNENPSWFEFYSLVCCSFNNQIRFNKNGGFNLPYGKRYYNSSMQQNLKQFVNKLQEKNVEFLNKDFRKLDFYPKDFLYLDPPYLNSFASYNESGGWSEDDEKDLLDVLDGFDKIGKFALSNNLKYENPILDAWKNKYNIHFITGDYSNCNYHKADRYGDVEVLITNY